MSRSAYAVDDRRQAEADHRLANSLQLATVMLRQESRRLTDLETARSALEAASLRLMAMSRLHRHLSGAASDGAVDLGALLDPIRRDIEESIGVTVDLRASDMAVPAATATQIGIVMNELAMNAVKHAVTNTDKVMLSVEAVRNGHESLRITLSDNGSGLPDGFRIGESSGLGMRIITSSVENLGGTIRTISGAGATFEIDLPLS